MEKKDLHMHLFLKQEIGLNKTKHIYFRFTDTTFQCEEFIYENGNVLDLKHYYTDKNAFEEITNSKKTIGSSPIIYFGKKGGNWIAFNENEGIE